MPLDFNANRGGAIGTGMNRGDAAPVGAGRVAANTPGGSVPSEFADLFENLLVKAYTPAPQQFSDVRSRIKPPPAPVAPKNHPWLSLQQPFLRPGALETRQAQQRAYDAAQPPPYKPPAPVEASPVAPQGPWPTLINGKLYHPSLRSSGQFS